MKITVPCAPINLWVSLGALFGTTSQLHRFVTYFEFRNWVVICIWLAQFSEFTDFSNILSLVTVCA